MKTSLWGKRFQKIVLLLIGASITWSCQKDDDVIIKTKHILTSVSGNEISMNGIWLSGCVEANNSQILNESLSFNNENLVIEIKGYDNLQCSGTTVFNDIININFNKSGTTNVNFEGKSVVVNTIDGTATYTDGRVEGFKQIFFIDDSGAEMFMHHALFEDDGGQTNENGYPVELIPIPITKN